MLPRDEELMRAHYEAQGASLEVLHIESRHLRKQAMATLLDRQTEIIRMELARVAASGDPIVVGPWSTEPGIELMFWVPLLRWFQETFSVEAGRIVAISRGGVRAWYDGVADGYVDMFDFMSLDEIQDQESSAKDAKRKPVEIQPWERTVFSRVCNDRGWRRAQWIHPALLFNFTRAVYSAGPEGDRLLLSMTRHRLMGLPSPPKEIVSGLPSEFVAMRFYTQATKGALWDAPENARAVREFIRLLSERIPVVDLNPGYQFRDHTALKWDFAYDANDRIWTLNGRADLRTNLGVQAWLISQSRAFVGTLGGLSCIASVTGVPALTFTALHGYPFLTPYRRYSVYVFRQLRAKYAISNPLEADLPTLVDALVADISGGEPFPWPVGPDARADGESSDPREPALGLVRVPSEEWLERKRNRTKLRKKLRDKVERP